MDLHGRILVNNYDRTSVIVGVILVGIVLLQVLEIPERAFRFEPFGTPLTVRVTGTWIVSALLVGLACAGTETVMRTHPAVRRRTIRYTFPTWILPGLATAALAMLLPRSGTVLYWLIGMVLGGGLLAWLMLAHYRALTPEERPRGLSGVALRLSAYLLGLILFTAIYRTRMRSLVTATATTLIAFLLSLSLLSIEKLWMRRMLLYAAVIALVLGQTTWAFNYWRADSLTVGVLMMLLFYVLVGIVQEHVRHAIDRQVIVEFSVVAALGIWIVFRFGPR
jgi:intracellular septation protein A